MTPVWVLQFPQTPPAQGQPTPPTKTALTSRARRPPLPPRTACPPWTPRRPTLDTPHCPGLSRAHLLAQRKARRLECSRNTTCPHQGPSIHPTPGRVNSEAHSAPQAPLKSGAHLGVPTSTSARNRSAEFTGVCDTSSCLRRPQIRVSL